MKKRLEAELISIAHRILKLKNVSELKQLHLETQKLYETLSVLKFVEENMNIIQPKIDVEDIEKKLEKSNEILAIANEEIAAQENNLAIANEEIVDEKIPEIENEIIAVANDEIAEDKIPEIQNEILTDANDEIIEKEIITEENEPIFVPEFELEKAEINFDKKPEPVQISFDEFKFSEPIFEKKSDVTEVKQVILNE